MVNYSRLRQDLVGPWGEIYSLLSSAYAKLVNKFKL